MHELCSILHIILTSFARSYPSGSSRSRRLRRMRIRTKNRFRLNWDTFEVGEREAAEEQLLAFTLHGWCMVLLKCIGAK